MPPLARYVLGPLTRSVFTDPATRMPGQRGGRAAMRYDPVVKETALLMVRSGVPVAAAAREVGISASTVRHWLPGEGERRNRERRVREAREREEEARYREVRRSLLPTH